jgi:hypothetical protein
VQRLLADRKATAAAAAKAPAAGSAGPTAAAGQADFSFMELVRRYRPPPSVYDAELKAAFAAAMEAVTSGPAQGWKLMKRIDSVDIFVRKIDGSPINQSKGACVRFLCSVAQALRRRGFD